MCSLKVSRCLQPVSSSLSCGNLGSCKLSQPAEFRIPALACFKPHSIPASWGGGGWKETTGKESVLFPGDSTWEFRLLICSGGFHGLSSLKTTSPLPCAHTRGGVKGKKPGAIPWITSSCSQEQALMALRLVSSAMTSKGLFRAPLESTSARCRYSLGICYNQFASPHYTGSRFISKSSNIKSDRFTLLLYK